METITDDDTTTNPEAENDNVKLLDDDDFVYSRHFNPTTGERYVTSGGYRIKSAWLQGGKVPITTWNNGTTADAAQETQKGGGEGENKRVSEPFEHFVVPTGMLALQRGGGGGGEENARLAPSFDVLAHTPVSDDLFDRLFSLAEVVAAGGGKGGGRRKENAKKEEPTPAAVPKKGGRKTKRHRLGGGGGANKRRFTKKHKK